MSKPCAYIFLDRNMGSGYSTANAPCAFWKRWLFRGSLFPIAAHKFESKIDSFEDNAAGTAEKLRAGLLSDWSLWHGYYVSKYERCPDERCTDPLAKGRNPKFILYIVLEGEPELAPFDRFSRFVDECIATAYEVMTPGVNENLRIEIPSDFFVEGDE